MHCIASLAPGDVYTADMAPSDKPRNFFRAFERWPAERSLTPGASHAAAGGLPSLLRSFSPAFSASAPVLKGLESGVRSPADIFKEQPFFGDFILNLYHDFCCHDFRVATSGRY